jgi:hypothetical protein
MTHLFLLANGLCYFGYTYWTEKFSNNYLYDPWDRYKTLFDDPNSKSGLAIFSDLAKTFGKLGITTLAPKNNKELLENVSMIYIFGRPLELLVGSKILLGTYATSLFFTWLCTIPSQRNRIRSESIDSNSLAYCFSYSVAVFFNFTSATKCYKLLSILSWVPVIGFIFNFMGNADYEYRPIFLTSILMSLYLRWKFRII